MPPEPQPVAADRDVGVDSRVIVWSVARASIW